MKEQIEKQAIAEMASVMMKHCEIDNQCGSCHWSTCNECFAEVLYKAGYHKQSEVERLKKENKILSQNADTAFQDGLNEAQDLYKEQIKAEVAREIFEEIEEMLISSSLLLDCTMLIDAEMLAELKKKYTEGEPNG